MNLKKMQSIELKLKTGTLNDLLLIDMYNFIEMSNSIYKQKYNRDTESVTCAVPSVLRSSKRLA